MAYISPFGPANMMLVVDSSLNIQKILDILQLIDTDQRRERSGAGFPEKCRGGKHAEVVREWLGSKDKEQASRPQRQPTAAGS